MKNEKLKRVLWAILSIVLFSLLFGITVILAGLISFAFIGPNINAISTIILPLIIGLPVAYILFFIFKFANKASWKTSYLVPAIIFPVLFGLAFGWTMHERDPKNIFEVFVLDPLPSGVSNITARDISGGFETEIIVTFKTTPQITEKIITTHKLQFDKDTDTFDINPNDFFPNLNWNEDWERYIRLERDNEIITTLWVNPSKSEAVFWFLAY
ncbi:MAG: hypothetical protein H7Y59_03075 [Anaerolineales bacterium]|nr:hypothetical protein [Anaerolineales bacterium]